MFIDQGLHSTIEGNPWSPAFGETLSELNVELSNLLADLHYSGKDITRQKSYSHFSAFRHEAGGAEPSLGSRPRPTESNNV